MVFKSRLKVNRKTPCFLCDLACNCPNWNTIQSTLINYSSFLIFRKKCCITRSQLMLRLNMYQNIVWIIVTIYMKPSYLLVITGGFQTLRNLSLWNFELPWRMWKCVLWDTDRCCRACFYYQLLCLHHEIFLSHALLQMLVHGCYDSK